MHAGQQGRTCKSWLSKSPGEPSSPLLPITKCEPGGSAIGDGALPRCSPPPPPTPPPPPPQPPPLLPIRPPSARRQSLPAPALARPDPNRGPSPGPALPPSHAPTPAPGSLRARRGPAAAAGPASPRPTPKSDMPGSDACVCTPELGPADVAALHRPPGPTPAPEAQASGRPLGPSASPGSGAGPPGGEAPSAASADGASAADRCPCRPSRWIRLVM